MWPLNEIETTFLYGVFSGVFLGIAITSLCRSLREAYLLVRYGTSRRPSESP